MPDPLLDAAEALKKSGLFRGCDSTAWAAAEAAVGAYLDSLLRELPAEAVEAAWRGWDAGPGADPGEQTAAMDKALLAFLTALRGSGGRDG